MMLFLHIRCDECRLIYAVRRPKDTLLISKILALVQCPVCHPEALKDVCAACRLPFALFPHHADELDFTCYQRLRRVALQGTDAC